MQIEAALRAGTEILRTQSIESARLDATLLLADLLQIDRLALHTRKADELAEIHQREFDARIERRARHEPVAHILGYRDFYEHRFEVSPHVLIPRPETEQIVQIVLEELRPPDGSRLLDLCTGSGCIGISLLHALNNCEVVLTDLSPQALEVARRNLLAIAPGAARRCRLYEGDLFTALPEAELAEPYFAIVSNPPYIAPDEVLELAPDVRDYEPGLALLHAEPPQLYRKILAEAATHVETRGFVLLELGPRFADEILTIADEYFARVELRKDYAGLARLVLAREPRKIEGE